MPLRHSWSSSRPPVHQRCGATMQIVETADQIRQPRQLCRRIGNQSRRQASECVAGQRASIRRVSRHVTGHDRRRRPNVVDYREFEFVLIPMREHRNEFRMPPPRDIPRYRPDIDCSSKEPVLHVSSRFVVDGEAIHIVETVEATNAIPVQRQQVRHRAVPRFHITER
jgi:hypothetical protein